MTRRILQFGTSRFLQAHADLFIHQARESGQDIGPVTVVKTTPGSDRAGRVGAFSDPAGFPVRIKGFEAGHRIDTEIRVKSVTRAIAAHQDWTELANVFSRQTELVITNTGETGYNLDISDRNAELALAGVPSGFPAKLLRLLVHRFENGGEPLLILPCELVSNNGQALRRILETLAVDWHLSDRFLRWLREAVTICDTLVDRIVSEALDPIGAVAEPYALWAICGAPGMAQPFTHPNVVYTSDLTPYLRLKLHILNLGHTWLAQQWLTQGRPGDQAVRQILSSPKVRADLLTLYNDEVISGFSAMNMESEAQQYVARTLERFDNPFLNHPLSDIAQNHSVKIRNRVTDFLTWVRSADPAARFPRLQQLASETQDG